MTTIERISPARFLETAGLEDWRVLGEGAVACFRTGSFATGVRFAQAVAELTGDRRPALDLRDDSVTVRLITVSAGYYGLTATEVELARQVSAIARELGTTADPAALHGVELAIDALARADVMPFWRAVLGYVDRGDGDEDLIDPDGRGPAFWFQAMDAPRPQRNRIHLDVWVAHDHADARVAAAIAAGGRLLDDSHAPSWWILADAEGNEACICTALTRD